MTSTQSLEYLSGFLPGHKHAMHNADNPLVTIVDQQLESTLDSVDASEDRAKVLASGMGFPEEDAYQIGYAVREALVNAVVHGNRYSANKAVHFVMSRVGGSLHIMIEDEGRGFDPEEQADPLANENLLNQSGRGIMIIRAFMDDFVIEKTERGGTRVVMKKSLPPGT